MSKKAEFKRLTLIAYRGKPGGVCWVNWNQVAELHRVEEKEMPPYTQITLILRTDTQMILRVLETPETLTGVWH